VKGEQLSGVGSQVILKGEQLQDVRAKSQRATTGIFAIPFTVVVKSTFPGLQAAA
jgi:hypothetical protein